MKERDIFEEIIDVGKRRGVLTYDQINEALPSEYFSPDEIEDLMDLLQDMGVKVTDSVEDEAAIEEELDEEPVEYEKTEDLVQAYFHSMGIFLSLRRTGTELLRLEEEEYHLCCIMPLECRRTARLEREHLEEEEVG
jgi:RNA polymerase primary sigma factor